MAYEAACLHVVVKANIAGQLIEHPSGLSLQALAAKSNIAAGKLGSVLRLLAAQHCFSESGSLFEITVSTQSTPIPQFNRMFSPTTDSLLPSSRRTIFHTPWNS